MKIFKILIVLMCLAGGDLALAFSEIPTTNVFTISATEAQLSIDAEDYAANFVDIHFSKDESSLLLNSKTEVSFIQVMNADGQLEFQLPVFSKDITLDLNDFSSGSYALNLMVEGKNEVIHSQFVRL